MTVILGYINTNETDRISALFSDNLENRDNKRIIVDKLISIQKGRFTLGIFGLGIITWVINDWIKYYDEYEDPKFAYDSIEDFRIDLEKGINFCIDYWKANKIIDETYIKQYEDYSSGIVLLDNQEQKLYYFRLGKIFNEQCKITVTELEKGKLYEFGISALSNSNEYLETTFKCFSKSETINYMREYIRELHSNYKNEIGLLGSYYLKINSDSTFVSSFSEKEELIKNKFCR